MMVAMKELKGFFAEDKEKSICQFKLKRMLEWKKYGQKTMETYEFWNISTVV